VVDGKLARTIAGTKQGHTMLFEAFRTAAGSYPSSSGVRLNGKTYSYAELAERAERLASGFVELGIGKGDAVAILMRNSPDLLVVIHALFAVGGIGVPLDVAGNPAELVRTLEQIKLRAVIASPDLATVAGQLAEATGVQLPVILSQAEGKLSLSGLEKTAPGQLPAVGADDPCVYLFSSGSTGRPKVVPRTHGELLSDFTGSAPSFDFRPEDILVNLLPGHHAFGLTLSMVYMPLSGTTSLLWQPNQPLMLARDSLLETIAAEKVTQLPGVPFLFDLLNGAAAQVALPSVRAAFSGAVALRKATFDTFLARFGLPIRQALGTTETSVVSYNMSDDPVATWNSVGQIVGDNKVEVVPVEESPDPEIGELLISSPAVTKGYLNNPEANQASFRNGAWVSGDLGRIAPDGSLYITGRKKLMVDVAGLKVDPVEVEDVLLGHPAVSEVVVVGVPDKRTGEQRLKAVVVKKADETAEALVAYARGHLSAHKVPYLVEFRDTIPRSVTGKILRGKLVE
jgi:acyl-CoA synthetase (AMP-forming)/AMP-acid ligase II